VAWLVQRFPRMDEDEVESKGGEPDLLLLALLVRKNPQHIRDPVERQVEGFTRTAVILYRPPVNTRNDVNHT
jgi:hypothetical protein